MARATLSTVQRIVWDNLGVTLQSSGYGNLDTANQRYLSGYINDKIAEADIAVTNLLFKNKQHSLLQVLYASQSSISSGTVISQNWIIVDISIDSEIGVEIPYGQYEQLAQGGIFDTSTYKGYYAKKDSKIFFIGTTATVTYIDVTHPTNLSTLISPSGFEGAIANLASALLLRKRNDQPEQAEGYYKEYTNFMQQFMLPDSNIQDIITD